MNAPAAHQHSARGDLWAMGAAALVCVSLYFGVASMNREAYRARPVTCNYYNLLVDGFLSGHLYMDLDPGPDGARIAAGEIRYVPRLHDVSLYGGKCYLYFGVAPAVVLFLPWKVLTGSDLGQFWAAAIFASIGYLASLALLARLKRDHFPFLSPRLLFGTGLILGLINWWPILLSRVGVWEVPIASAFCFSALAVLGIHAGTAAGGRNGWLAAASAFIGLAVASRPDYILGPLVMALPLLYLWRSERASPVGKAAWIRRFCAAGLPVAGVGMLLASYNFLRFGNPFELGIQYMVLVEPNPPKSFSLSYVWTNLSLYFLDPARFSPWFPFFKVSRIPLLPKGYAADPEEMYGMLANLPVLLLAPVGAALAGTWGKFSRPALVAAAATLLFVSVAGVILLYVGANNRYTVDAMCGLPVLTILGIWTVEARVRSGGLRRRLARVLWTALAGYSALFALCAAAERDGIFGYIHPRAYGMLAHAGDFPSFWYDRIRDVTYGPVRLSVRFPADRLGRNEPLVYTGWGPRSNVLFVHYVDPAHIQLGFMGANGTSRGAPLAIDYAKPHSLTVSMGSFYPPRDHPFFDSLPVEDAETLSGTLFVELDGRTVLHQRVYFFDAVARKPELGRGPAALGREWVFTGRMTGG